MPCQQGSSFDETNNHSHGTCTIRYSYFCPDTAPHYITNHNTSTAY